MSQKLPITGITANLILATLLCRFLLSCTLPVHLIPSQITIDKADKTMGIAVFSISVNNSDFTGYTINIVHNEYKMTGELAIHTLYPDIKKDTIDTYFRALQLPTGKYRIYGWAMSSGDGKSERIYFPKGNFSIPFTIYGGRVNYLGDYMGVSIIDPRFPKFRIASKGYFVVSDQFEADYETLIVKFPKLDLNKVLLCIPDFARYNKNYSGMYLKGIQIP
jgi:hypothetical protein